MARITKVLAVALFGLLTFLAGWHFSSLNHERTFNRSNQLPYTQQPPSVSNAARNQLLNTDLASPSISSFNDIDFSRPASELLAHADNIESDPHRQLYLKTLVDYWVNHDPEFSPEAREKLLAGLPSGPDAPAYGFEAQLSQYVSMLADESIRKAWKKIHENHPARSEIYSLFLSKDIQDTNPESLFEISSQWTPWEQHHYNGDLLFQWASIEPNRAFDWYLSHPTDFGPDAERQLLDAWAQHDFDGLEAHWETIQNEQVRQNALEAMAKQKAYEGTDDALDWANSLADTDDQDVAHDVIYRETPRGIGAVLATKNGFPEVRQTLVPNGLEPGDLLVSASHEGRPSTTFFGKDLLTSVEALRGPPGTHVTVQVMRRDPETGDYRQVEITITRQQLWMETDHKP